MRGGRGGRALGSWLGVGECLEEYSSIGEIVLMWEYKTETVIQDPQNQNQADPNQSTPTVLQYNNRALQHGKQS